MSLCLPPDSTESHADAHAHLQEGMRLSDYHYELPEELIARYPLARRDQSRMLHLDRRTGVRSHRCFMELPEFLNPGDLLVLNNTRVLPARFRGHRRGRSGKVEILLLHPSAENPLEWTALMKPTRKLKPGTIVEIPGTSSVIEVLGVDEKVRGRVLIHLDEHPTVGDMMAAVGEMPIPPYLNRPAEDADKETYQTVFAKEPGAQAAPTAGLHFTPEVLDTLREKGIGIQEITLAVSSGTFRNVADEDITQHVMDPEHYTLSEETAEAIRGTKARGGRVFAVGTTVAKTLETVAKNNNGQLRAESDWSRLFIYPGFQFQVVDGLLTNFHLPKTTLMMLVSAFSSREHILAAYEDAVSLRYRFFSYGDCMLIS